MSGQQAESSDYRKILVIPFDRFEFHTEIKLDLINEINGMIKDQYYHALVQAMSDAFKINEDHGVRYAVIEEEDWNLIKSFISFSFVNGEHFSSDLQRLHMNSFAKLLRDYGCDELLIITWYRILESRESVVSEGVRKVNNYAEQYIDYDLYSGEKKIIKYGAYIKFEIEPTPSNLRYCGLRLSELRPVLLDLVNRISREINTGD